MNFDNIKIFKQRDLFANLSKTNALNGTYSKATLFRKYRVATSIFFFIAGLTFSTWASRIPAIQAKLHLTDAGLGGVLFALPLGLMAGLPLSGWMVSKFGSKPMMICAAILYPGILFLLASSTSVPQLTTSLFLFGFFGNLLNIAMNTQAVGVEGLYGRSVMASFHGLWSLAGFSGALIGTFFVSQHLSPLIHFSVVIFLALGLVLFFFNNTLPHDTGTRKTEKIFVRPDKKILLLGLIAFCTLLCEGAMADWSGIYFKTIVSAPAALITLGYVAFTSTMALGRFIGDSLVTKFGVKRMLQISGILITAGLLLSVFLPYLITATAGFLLVGFGVSSVVPIVYGVAGKSKTMSPGTALAAVSTIGFLGFLVGPPLIGFIAQAISLRWSFTLIGVLGFGTAILGSKLLLEDTLAEEKIPSDVITQESDSILKAEPVRRGYVAWPENTEKKEVADQGISYGRTRNGGLVTYPKES